MEVGRGLLACGGLVLPCESLTGVGIQKVP